MKIYPIEIIEIDNQVRCQVKVESSFKHGILWYGVSPEYRDYFEVESLDAFLLALLPLAMKLGENIELMAPISKKLFHNVSMYVIHLLNVTDPSFKKIKIQPLSLVTPKTPPASGVVTGFSAGIDSFCVLNDYLQQSNFEGYSITHFVCNNVGAFGAGGTSLYEKRYQYFKQSISEIDLPYIGIDSNLHTDWLFNIGFAKTLSLRNVSAILCLSKLFGKYLVASGYKYEDCVVKQGINMALMEPTLLPLLSTEITDCIGTGSQYSRIEKTQKVSQLALSYNKLNVCIRNSGVNNCSSCYKCLRTQVSLEVLGKFHLYQNVFNLRQYKKYRLEYMSGVLWPDQFYKSETRVFKDEILSTARHNSFQFPLVCRLFPPIAFQAYRWLQENGKNFLVAITTPTLRKTIKRFLKSAASRLG